MRKTVAAWMNELPVRHRAKAIKNMQNSDDDKSQSLTESRRDALEMAFFWHESPEGHDYWSKLHKTL